MALLPVGHSPRHCTALAGLGEMKQRDKNISSSIHPSIGRSTTVAISYAVDDFEVLVFVWTLAELRSVPTEWPRGLQGARAH